MRHAQQIDRCWVEFGGIPSAPRCAVENPGIDTTIVILKIRSLHHKRHAKRTTAEIHQQVAVPGKQIFIEDGCCFDPQLDGRHYRIIGQTGCVERQNDTVLTPRRVVSNPEDWSRFIERTAALA